MTLETFLLLPTGDNPFQDPEKVEIVWERVQDNISHFITVRFSGLHEDVSAGDPKRKPRILKEASTAHEGRLFLVLSREKVYSNQIIRSF